MMSKMVRYTGTARFVPKHDHERLESQLYRLCGSDKHPADYESLEEYIVEVCADRYFVYHEDVYAITKYPEEVRVGWDAGRDEWTFDGSFNTAGDIDFDVEYYDGALTLSDALNNVLYKFGN